MCALKSDINRQINDISECSICADTYNDPRVLPCIHTFCLRCLEAYGKGKLPGSGMLCPLCRKSFAVPKAGLKDLPKNTLAQQLVDTIGDGPKGDVNSVRQAITRKSAALLRQKEQIDVKWAQFTQNSTVIEHDIQQHQDYLKRLIDDSAEALLNRLKTIRQQELAVVQTERAEIDRGLARLNDLLMRSTGNSESENSKTSTDEWRAIQAEANAVLGGIQQPRELANISFQPRALLDERKPSLIGSISVSSEAKSTKRIESAPRLVKTLMSGVNADGVMGLSVLDDRVYIVRNWATTVDVHDLAFSAVQRQISVCGLDLPNDMAGCRRHNCLYITDYSPYVHRVEVGIGGVCNKWLAGDGPLAVSVSGSTANVIVTLHTARREQRNGSLKPFYTADADETVSNSVASCIKKVKEFSTNGSLLREISLSPELVNPHHAVVLNSGELLVSHGFETDPSNRLCIVDDVTGEVIKSLESDLRQPARIAVDAVGGIAYVADLKNDRVVLVDLPSLRSLSFVTEVGRRPYAMFVDKGTRTFYVGSWEDGQISVFDISDVHCVDTC